MMDWKEEIPPKPPPICRALCHLRTGGFSASKMWKNNGTDENEINEKNMKMVKETKILKVKKLKNLVFLPLK